MKLQNLLDRIVKSISIIRYNKMLLKRATKQAKTNWIKTGKRHYVISIDNKYLVMNDAIIDTLKKPNGKRFSSIERFKMAAYVTPVSTFHNI